MNPLNRGARTGAFALAACALSACQTMPTVDGAAEAAAIRAQDAAWVEAVATGDPAKMVGFYSGDAVFMPPNEDAKTGDAIKQSWAGMAGLKNVKLTFGPNRIEVDADGEMAIDLGTYQISFDGPAGRIEDHGKYAQVWEKRDGAWKCAVDMYNSSVPLPPPPPPPAAAPAPKAPAAPAKPAKKKKK